MHLELILALVVTSVTLAQIGNNCRKIYFHENDFIDVNNDSIVTEKNESYVCAPTTPPAETTTILKVRTTTKLSHFNTSDSDNEKQSLHSGDPNAKSNHPSDSDKIDSNLKHIIDKLNLSLYSKESMYSPDSEEYKTKFNEINVIASLKFLKQNISFIAEIRTKNNYPVCAGSVISKRHVLSLSQCDGEKPLKSLQIVVGLVFSKYYDIQEKIAQNNIALFQTFHIIEVGWKMNVPKNIEAGDKDMTVYMLTSMAFPSSVVSVIDTELCKIYFEKFSQLNKLCFTGVPCTTFNGMPVVNRNNEIVGITTANDIKGWINCKNGQTTIGLDVSKYSDWIETQIGPYKL